ncbi:MAG: FAD-binding oxidoreductase [Gemmatimonadaceae bacterium]
MTSPLNTASSIPRSTHIEGAAQTLAARLEGTVLTPSSPDYDDARRIWNAMIDRRPALIARCASVADVQHAIRFARDHGLPIAVRGGGHNIAGSAICDGGLVIDLSSLKRIHVDQGSRTARADPGLTLAEFDRATQEFGLATPLGINSTTGIAGLTLGGGIGWLTRPYGMTVDSLRSVDIVTAAGELMTASEQSHPDLFWALRGGGGNFGVVTQFEYDLHAVGPQVLAGLIVHPFDNAAELLRRYREVAAQAPDELSVWVVLRKAPPLPFLPTEVHGTNVVVFAVLYSGDMKAGEHAVAPLRALGKPIADVVSPHPYTGFQAAFDPLLTPGARNYWKTHNLTQLDDGVIDAVVTAVPELPSPQCEVFLAQLGGAAQRVSADATAYVGRDAAFVLNVHGRWTDAAQDDDCIGWARKTFSAVTPYATGGAYVNFMTQDESDRVRQAYGAHYARLAGLKRTYDPENVFHLNQNIVPA